MIATGCEIITTPYLYYSVGTFALDLPAILFMEEGYRFFLP